MIVTKFEARELSLAKSLNESQMSFFDLEESQFLIICWSLVEDTSYHRITGTWLVVR